MTQPIIKIHNATTGEIIEREMTADELAQAKIDDANFEAFKKAEAAKAEEKAALLNRFGISAEEAALLLG